jgi:hypothetical protein
MEIKYEFDYVWVQTLSKSKPLKNNSGITVSNPTIHVCKLDTGHSTRDTKIKKLGCCEIPRGISLLPNFA